MVVLRDATPEDFPAVLALNAGAAAATSPMDAKRLATLHSEAAYHRLIEGEGVVRAFLLAFREGAAYDSPNYRWFAGRYDHFLYIDRVVVAEDARRGGLGSRLYRDLFAFAARAGVPRIVCEYNIKPPNPASARFHDGFGFREVGQQRLAGGKKVVSLQSVAIPERKKR
jgi:hypothetical protein